MAVGLDTERLRLAFPSRPDLVAGIQEAADSPARITLFNDIVSYVHSQLDSDEPALKRRRVGAEIGADEDTKPLSNGTTTLPQRQAAAAGGVGGGPAALVAAAAEETPVLEVKDISLSLPLRKKFDLCFTENYLYARAPGTTAPVQGLVYAWKDIEHIFYVPVPEKAQLQYNYILLPRGQALACLSKPSTSDASARPEPLLFTVPSAAPKPGSVAGAWSAQAAAVSDAYSSLLHWALEGCCSGCQSDVRVVGTDPKIFHSVAHQAYRPRDKAVHVRAFRGSKDGYLFFLSTGILWGFKKPLLFIPLNRIAAISYTNVLQRTFNMVVEVEVGDSSGGEGEEDVEFGMLDQEDYGGIDETFVRRHNLQDRSMAEQRKAKRELAENAKDDKEKEGEDVKKEGNEDTSMADGEDGMTELQRAEKQLQDDEDEMEEDYDPGSDDDSDGSGSSSEDEGEEADVDEVDEADEDEDEDEDEDDNEEDNEGENIKE